MKLKNIIFTLAGIAVLGACSLEEYPYGFYSENNFYKTSEDAEAAVVYIYDAINYIEYSRAIVFLGDMNTDFMTHKGDAAAANQELHGWKTANLKTNTTLGNFYKYSYITINRANAVIKNVANMDIDEDLKDKYLGEAFFMRGYSYFCLTRNFGCVPVHLKPVETLEDSTVPPAESLDKMWEIVLGDFSEAARLLPLYDKPQTGRVDKAAAYGMLAKSYLYIASSKDHGAPGYTQSAYDVNDCYGKAVTAASAVVDSDAQTTYDLDPNLLDIYDVDKPDGPEHLFIMSMDRTGASEGQYSKISKMYIPYISGASVYLKQGDSDNLIKTHDGWSEYQTTEKFLKHFEDGDLRHKWLFCREVYNEAGEVVASIENGKLPYEFCRKFIDPNFSGDKTSTKPFLLRYSDVALIYAEAAGPTEKSYELVNAIRNRAGLGNLQPGLSLTAFREKVFEERSYELAFEGDYCYDLRRWNKLADITAVKEQGLTADDVAFYPIPSLETDLNPYFDK